MEEFFLEDDKEKDNQEAPQYMSASVIKICFIGSCNKVVLKCALSYACVFIPSPWREGSFCSYHAL